MNFINNIFIAFANPKKYYKLLNIKHSFTLIYIIILLLLSMSTYILGLTSIYKNIGTYYTQVVPEFEFKENKLTMAKPFKLELMGQIIYADSNKELTSNDFGNNPQGILLDENSLIIRQMNNDTEVAYAELTAGKNITFSKNDTHLFAPQLKMIFAIFIGITILTLSGGFFLGALFVAFISKIPNMAAKIRFSKLYKLALFSRGLPALISLLTSFFMPGMPLIVNFLISCIIMNIALGTIAKNNIV